MAKLIVLLDAGHGLNTPGKRSPDGTLREFHFNSVVTEKIAKKLEGYQDVEVHFVYDRDGSIDTQLAERTKTANAIYNAKKATGAKFIYLSVHANAFGSGWNSANGIETYIYPSAGQATKDAGLLLHNNLVNHAGLANRGLKTANFQVLRETAMNAVLVECGFMTNQTEAELLKSENYREKVANGLTAGLVQMGGLVVKPQPKPTPAPVNPNDLNDGLFYRVVTGSFDSKASAEARIAELKKAGFDSFLLPYNK